MQCALAMRFCATTLWRSGIPADMLSRHNRRLQHAYSLLPQEALYNKNDACVGIVDVFEGAPPVQQLQERAEAILSRNPIFSARARTSPSGVLELVVPDTPPPLECFFKQLDASDLSEGAKDVGEVLQAIGLGPTLNLPHGDLWPEPIDRCIDHDEPLMKVCDTAMSARTALMLLV